MTNEEIKDKFSLLPVWKQTALWNKYHPDSELYIYSNLPEDKHETINKLAFDNNLDPYYIWTMDLTYWRFADKYCYYDSEQHALRSFDSLDEAFSEDLCDMFYTDIENEVTNND